MVEIGDEPNRVTIYKVMSSAPYVYSTNAYDLKHSWIHRNLGNEWRFRGSKHKGMTPPPPPPPPPYHQHRRVLHKIHSKKNKHHYDDVIMTTIASQITSLTVVYSVVYSGADQRNIKAPRHWPLCGEFTGTGEFPAQRASYAENVSIWWRHHDDKPFFVVCCG